MDEPKAVNSISHGGRKGITNYMLLSVYMVKSTNSIEDDELCDTVESPHSSMTINVTIHLKGLFLLTCSK